MFKRTSKITALMIAVASVISMVPASADVVTLSNVDGSMEKVVPFMDGTYVYQGSKGENFTGVYYYNGKEDVLLDDIDELGDDKLGVKFGSQYAVAKNGDSDSLVDLLTGEIASDTASDLMQTVKNRLERKLEKTERYGEDITLTLKPIPQNTSGDEWYYYEAATKISGPIDNPTTMTYSGYVNQSGQYIDCSKKANISLFNGKRMVLIEDFDKSKTVDGKKLSVKIDYNSSTNTYAKTLGQDSNYIYREIRVIPTGHKAFNDSRGLNGTDLSGAYFIQKISKEQGEKEDEAYLPKDVTSFELSTSSGIGDAGSAVSYMQNSGNYLGQYVLDGNIIQQENYGTVRTSRIGMWTNKVNIGGTTQTVDVNLVRKTANNTQGDVLSKTASVIDAKGDIWVLTKYGEIKCANAGGKFWTAYTVDPEFDSLAVYDSNNLVVWKSGGEKFTSVEEGKAAALNEANQTIEEIAASTGATITNVNDRTTSVAVTTKVGWDNLADGTKNFYDGKGNKVSDKWINVGGNAYYLKADGVMTTGWLNYNGNWYYFNSNGSMKIGWLKDNGNWYFIQPSGIMKTGWLRDNGKWYYCSSDGSMKIGWLKDNGKWYYCNSDGSMKIGWLNDNGNWYYLNQSGVMLSNTTIDGYILDASGTWSK